MKSFIKYTFLTCLAAFLWIAAPQDLNATHIVGGKMTYRLSEVTADSFTIELQLNIFRDCFFGDPDVYFDDPAYIAVYDQFFLLRDNIELQPMGDDTLTNSLPEECLVNLSPVCVHTTVYQTTLTLPRLPGGYTFSYQRCCRNQTINNIVNPLETGATYFVEVTDFALERANRAPDFIQVPAIYICANQPLVFDHSAVDDDSDSLVYRLFTPFEGGTLSDYQPNPANPPPYDTVIWAPGYSKEDMLGSTNGGTPLAIDPVTGLLTAFPTVTGQYVVGVLVEEYDRATGQLLSVIRRDFQYNVNPCGEITAAFFAPEVQCDDLTVSFENQSENASSYEWYFDWPNNTIGSTTTDTQFDYVFPDTGFYTVTLISEPNTSCADTFSQEIFLQLNSLTANYNLNAYSCDAFAVLDLQDASVDGVSPPETWFWSVEYDGSVQHTSTAQDTLFEVPLNTAGTITLEVISRNGCVSTFMDAFQTGADNPGDIILPTVRACIGENVGLNPNTPTDAPFTFSWSPATGLSDPNALNPTITATATEVFTVTVTPVGPNPACEIIRMVTLEVLENPVPSFTTDLDCDGLTINFANTTQNATLYTWDFGEPGSSDNTSTEVNPSHTYSALGTYLVTLTASNDDVCEFQIQQQVVIDEIQLEAAFSVAYSNCDNNSVTVQFTDESVNSNNDDFISSWLWDFGGLGSSSVPNPSFTFDQDGVYTITLTIGTDDGCSTFVVTPITIQLGPDSNQFSDTFLACPGDSTQLLPGGDPAFVYSWSPTTGMDDPTSPSPIFYPSATTEYTVTVQAIGADTCTVVETIIVNVPPALNLSVSGDGLLCTPTTTLVANHDGVATIEWCDEDGNVLSNDPTYTVDVSGTTNYTLKATDGNGCLEAVDFTVSGGPIDFTVPDTVAVCLGEEVLLSVTNLDDNDTLTYNWLPASLFVPGTNETNNPDYIEVVGEQTVSVVLNSQFGCTASEDIVVAVVDPAIDLSFDFTLDCNGGTVFFNNTSTSAFGYVWDFGDGSLPNYEESPQHTYVTAGTYPVTLSIVFDVDCVVDFTMDVTTQDPQVIADFTYDIVGCSANSAVIQFTDQSINTFNNTDAWNWTFDGGVPPTSVLQNPQITVFGEGDVEVTLVIETENNCSNMTSQTINVQLVDLDISPMDTVVVCRGDSVQLNPSGNTDYTYNWTPATGLSDAMTASPFASPNMTTTYSVTAYSTAGTDTCFVMDQVVVFIPADINLDLGADVVSTCGEDVTIVANTDVEVTVEWTSAVDGPIGSGMSITVNPFRTDTISAIATDEFGCTAMDTVIIIDNGVDIEVEPNMSIVACQGVDTILTIINLDEEDILTYSWTPLSNIVGPADGPSVNILLEDLGTVVFQAIVNNQLNCADTIEVTVTVEEFQGDLPDEVFVCTGVPTPLSPDANPNYEYTWDPQTGLDLTEPWNPIATLTEAQTYSVTIVDPATSCSVVDMMQVDIHPLINLETEGDATLCRVETLTLTATADVAVDIEWFLNNTSIDMGPEIMVVPAVGTSIYTAIATDPTTGCMDTSMVTVLIHPQLDLATTGDASICRFDATELTATSAVSTADIVWYHDEMEIGNGSPITVIPDMEGDNVYTAIATDPATACMDTSIVVLEVFPQIDLTAVQDTQLCEIVPIPLSAMSTTGVVVDIEWFLNETSVGVGAAIVVTPPDADMSEYMAIAIDPNTGCRDTATVIVRVQLFTNELPVDPTILCNEESTEINPGGDPDLVYEWSPMDENIDLTNPWNPVVTTDVPLTYFVTVTDPEFNCTVIDTVNIEVFPEVELMIDGEDLILCEDGVITLSATTTIDPATLIWYQLPDNTEIGTGAMIDFDPPLGTTIIYAEAISVDNCTERDTIQIDNYPIDASLPGELIFCVPTADVDLEVINGDPAQELDITWNPLGVITDPATGPLVIVDPNVTMDFTAMISNQFGCMDTLNTTIFVIDLNGDLSIVAEPDTITLNNSSEITVTGCDDCEFEWTWPSGDITPEDGPVITATPSEPGDNTYEVTVSILGCTQTLEVNVFVFDLICDTDHLYFPNAFSPNNDGANDELRLRSVYLEEINEMELLIYNRWGEEVFKTTNPFDSWDGTFHGELLPPDVYGYYLRVICPDEEELIQKGNITLLR